MKGQPAAPASIQRRVRRLALLIGLSAVAIVLVILGLLTVHTLRYSELLHNVTTASEFNQDFKSTIDQKMYYYVIGSQYSDGLPLAEVEAAQQLARELLDTTTQRESRLAISSVLHLCENLEEKIYQIRDTESYDERQAQLENNINVITSLIQEYMYNYLYYEAVQLNALQRDMQIRLMTELVLLALATAAIIWVLMRSALRIGRSITEPITRLCTRMEQIGNGDLAKHEPVPSDIFELRTLSEGFEDMAGRLNALMEETTQKQATLRRMELALLQAQINPHFLYNTMDTIIWLIEAGKNAEALTLLQGLEPRLPVENRSVQFRQMLAEAAVKAGQKDLAARTYQALAQEVKGLDGDYYRVRAEALAPAGGAQDNAASGKPAQDTAAQK